MVTTGWHGGQVEDKDVHRSYRVMVLRKQMWRSYKKPTVVYKRSENGGGGGRLVLKFSKRRSPKDVCWDSTVGD